MPIKSVLLSLLISPKLIVRALQHIIEGLLNLKNNYIKLPIDKNLIEDEDEPIASVVCLLIAPAYCKKVISKILLNESLKELKENGIKTVNLILVKNYYLILIVIIVHCRSIKIWAPELYKN